MLNPKTTLKPCLITDEETGDIYRFTIIDGSFHTILHAKRQPSEAEIALQERISIDTSIAHGETGVFPNSYWLTADELKLAKGFCLPERKIDRRTSLSRYEIYPHPFGNIYLYVRSEG